MQFAGEFETHLTVRLSRSDAIVDLRDLAQARGLKCLHIVLDRGSCISQPMLTRRGRGTLSTELAVAGQLTECLKAAGFDVSRIKLEACLENEDIPSTDEEAQGPNSIRYFEHHIKLLINNESEIGLLIDVAEGHSAHLSKNALVLRSDNRQERFITQRCRLVGLTTAQQRLQALLAELAHRNQDIIEIEQEYVVYDSNLALDRGWIKGEV